MMSRRSRKWKKKQIPCGHKGFGLWCHRCLPDGLLYSLRYKKGLAEVGGELVPPLLTRDTSDEGDVVKERS